MITPTIKLGGRPLSVDDGVLVEPASEDGRVVLWLPGERAGGFEHWDRLGIAAGASVTIAQGVCSLAAVSTPTRRKAAAGLAKLFRRLVTPKSDLVWTLPGGGSVERCGPRRTDLVLAWPEAESARLDEHEVRVRWPGAGDVRRIGRDLHLVSGVGPPRAAGVPAPAGEPPAPEELPPPVSALELAERALGEARRAGDLPREVTALIDLGVSHLNKSDARRAAPLLEAAMIGARRLGDRARVVDATVNLAHAALLLGHPGQAIAMLEPALADARVLGDRYAAKLALERLGFAHQAVAEHERALGRFEHALAIAREVGDALHEAFLHWHIGIEQAELGRPDRAIALGGEAVARLRRLGKPEAERYAHHLEQYRSSSLARSAVPAAGVGSPFGASVFTTDPQPRTSPESPVAGPGLLRMALTAARSAATFAGSGFKTVTAETYRARLAACSGCDQHTGLRCRVCGCITAAKARLPHEACPAGKWPP